VNELVVIVEGETEQTFVRDQLAASLAEYGTTAWPILPGRHRRHGGVRKWEATREDIIRTLREHRYCSTMFDYYAMPENWPGRAGANNKPWHERAKAVEVQIAADIQQSMGPKFNPKFFIPYVQLHEFEALAFAGVNQLASVVAPLTNSSAEILETSFAKILEEAGSPEAINDGYETCPSRRIVNIAPAYRKRLHGPIVTERIGLKVLRNKCDHFASWLARLESIGGD
jgi:hypothetical protein